MDRLVTHGEPVSPTILIILVDAVVRSVLLELCGPQEAQHGLVWVAVDDYIVLYADNSRIEVCNPIWVQTTLTVVVRIFDRVGLQKKIVKTKAMVFNPVFI